MLHPSAVAEFLKEERDSHVWMKGLSEMRLDKALADQGFKAASPKPLRKHQKVCILLGLAYPQFAYWLDMGTGKTRIVLELLNHFWRKGLLRRAMILAISDEAVYEWEKQIKKWDIKIPYAACGNSPTEEKWKSIADLGSGLIIATYPGFNWLFSSKQYNKKTKKTKMKPDDKRIKAFGANLQAFVWDESIHVGNHQSLGFKISKKLSVSCFIRYALAGVPFGKDPTILWSQQYLIDRGASLGDTLGLFRGAFFDEKPGWFGGYEYKFRKDMQDKLSELMQHRSMSYDASECLDLPPVTPIIREIKLPEANRAYFDKFMRELKEARIKKDIQASENIFLRMRQLSSGFIGYTDDETGERASFVFPDNPKLDDLMRQIEDMPANRKFVIFHEFTWSGRAICEALKARKIPHGWLWSGTKDRRAIRDRFDTEPASKMKGIVGNWRVCAESMNFQAANYKHFFESPVSVIMRKQSEKRCFRDGQKYPGFMFDYLATPADRKILSAYETGENLMDGLIKDPYSWRDF